MNLNQVNELGLSLHRCDGCQKVFTKTAAKQLIWSKLRIIRSLCGTACGGALNKRSVNGKNSSLRKWPDLRPPRQ